MAISDYTQWTDEQKERFLDQIKINVFQGKSAAFRAPVAARTGDVWDDSIPTAATDGINFVWNLKFLVGLTKTQRVALFMHELLHLTDLHHIRRGPRDPETWNQACDYKINLDLKDEGYDIESLGGLLDEAYRGMVEEEIYKILIKNKSKSNSGGGGQPNPQGGMESKDLLPVPQGKEPDVVKKVAQAIQSAKAMKKAGDIPGNIQEIVKQLIAPIVPWERVLYKFFRDLLGTKTTWRRPNRRYSDIYMPSRMPDKGRLEVINIYRDHSGSTRTPDIVRINSEIDYIWRTLKPKQINLIQFDTKIQKEVILQRSEQFDDFEARGRGGTHLECVRQHIIRTQPKAAVIFSDMECTPMIQEGIDIPVIWIIIGDRGHKPMFGETIHIPRGRHDRKR